MYWITENLGTASIREEDNDADEVVFVTDLNDGWNPPELIYLRAKQILVPVYQKKKVIIKCVAGISRSNGMATLILAFLKNISWDDAYTITRKKVPIAQVNPCFRECCVKALRLMKERLTKRCPYCGAPIEFWESACSRCWLENRKIYKMRR